MSPPMNRLIIELWDQIEYFHSIYNRFCNKLPLPLSWRLRFDFKRVEAAFRAAADGNEHVDYNYGRSTFSYERDKSMEASVCFSPTVRHTLKDLIYVKQGGRLSFWDHCRSDIQLLRGARSAIHYSLWVVDEEQPEEHREANQAFFEEELRKFERAFRGGGLREYLEAHIVLWESGIVKAYLIEDKINDFVNRWVELANILRADRSCPQAYSLRIEHILAGA